jgi:alpha-tubulin suppressor-like RCC1 family protein
MNSSISRWLPLAAAISFAFSLGCAPKIFTVGGQVAGLNGALALSLNSTENLNVAGNGSFGFATKLAPGTAYDVTVATQPAGQNCSVTNGTGQIASANITNVSVNCTTTIAAPEITHTWPSLVVGGYEARVFGSNLSLTSLTFNGAAIEPIFQTDYELRFIVPANPAGTYAVELENIAGYDSTSFTQRDALSGVIAISTGALHSCVVLSNGTVKCWGSNNWGQLGDGSTASSATPVTVSGIDNAVAIGADDEHSCAVLSTGAMKCWGSNVWGELGIGERGQYAKSVVPVTVIGIHNAVSVDVGGGHSCALLATGEINCWGRNNSYGELGDGSRVDRTTPVKVVGIDNAVFISAGHWHNCALLATGSVKCWGNGEGGLLGNGVRGSDYYRSSPVDVLGINNAVSISTGPTHSCAVLNTGSVQCWGWNNSGQLGSGNPPAGSATPVTVADVSHAISTSAGMYHNCVLLQGGTVQCWGENDSGQLSGDPQVLRSATPLEVIGINNVVSLNTGGSTICAIVNNDTARCWGRGSY